MTSITTKPDSSQPAAETAVHLFDNWFDPIEAGLRDRVREFIHAMIEGELDMALSRPRYARHAKPSSGEAEGAVGRRRLPPRPNKSLKRSYLRSKSINWQGSPRRVQPKRETFLGRAIRIMRYE